MTFYDVALIIVSVAAVGCVIYFLISLSRVSDRFRRARIRQRMVRTLSVLLVVLSFGVLLVGFNPDSVKTRSEAKSFTAQRTVAFYTLAVNSFEFGNSPYVLTLNYKGAEVINNVKWDILELPTGVFFADISRVNGQNVFTFAGFPPITSYVFSVKATVFEGNDVLVTVPLVVRIFSGLNI